MKGKVLRVITIAAAILTACTENDVTTNGTEVSMEAATEAPTMISTEAPTKAPAVLSMEAPTEAPTTSKAEISETSRENLERDYFKIKEIQKFLEAIKNGDADTVARYSISTKEAVDTWLPSIKLNSYELGDCVEAKQLNWNGKENKVGEYNVDYVLVKLDVSGTGNDVIHSGQGWYRFYVYGAMGPIEDICIDGEQQDMRAEQISYVCGRYENYIGWDFDMGNPEAIYGMDYPYQCLRKFAYVNHLEINSMEELSAALEENLGLQDIPWDYEELAYRDSMYKEYELAPKCGEWNYYGVRELTDDKCVVDYYADIFGFAVAKTVEYTYSVNENGNICITSVKTVNDTGLEVCYGHF